MKDLKELEKKYAELGKEIEALKSEYPIYCLSKSLGLIVKFTGTNDGVVVKQNKALDVGCNSPYFPDHTDTDSWQQLDVCPETGFYDGQLVWCWDNEHTHMRLLKFYDVKNKKTFHYSSKREGSSWDNYEPFEGNWPDWALEAFKTLER